MKSEIVLLFELLKSAIAETPALSSLSGDVEALENKAKAIAAAEVLGTIPLPLQNGEVPPPVPAPANPHRKNSVEEVVAVGDFYIWPDRKNVTLFLPRDTSPITLPVNCEGGWTLYGSDDFPTIAPSIFRDPPRGYHGYLQNGVLTADLNPAPGATPPVPPVEAEPVPVDQRDGYCP
jgi:hypothetical protein